jgi:hypothetical protein
MNAAALMPPPAPAAPPSDQDRVPLRAPQLRRLKMLSAHRWNCGHVTTVKEIAPAD